MTRRLLWACAMVIATAFAAEHAVAADVAAGRKKAVMCAGCHGVDGLHKNPDTPNLAGNSPTYLVRQLKAFKSGERQHDQMSIIAKGLDDDAIANLAAWYSAIVVKVELPK